MNFFDFPQSARIKTRHEFLRLQHKGSFFSGRYLYFQWMKSQQESGSRLGITVTKKYGNAVDRNHIKRLIREAFRLSTKNKFSAFDINIKPKTLAKKGSLQQLLAEFDSFFRIANSSG